MARVIRTEFELCRAQEARDNDRASRARPTNPGTGFGPDVRAVRDASRHRQSRGRPGSRNPSAGSVGVEGRPVVLASDRLHLQDHPATVARTWKRRDTGELVAAAPPPAVLDRSCADTGFLAGMMVDKFCWHLPLHRQHQRLEAAGIRIRPLEPGQLDASVGIAFDPDLRRAVAARSWASSRGPCRAGSPRTPP